MVKIAKDDESSRYNFHLLDGGRCNFGILCILVMECSKCKSTAANSLQFMCLGISFSFKC